MFKVKNINSKEYFYVYSVRFTNDGDLEFLIFNIEKEWIWVDAEYYEPVNKII